jgi:hypothetical protein
MQPNDPIRVTPLHAAGPLVRVTGHPDTLAEFMECVGYWVDHSFPLRSHNRPDTCSAWPTNAFDDIHDLIGAMRQASDLSGLDLVIEPAHAREPDESPEPISTSEQEE